MDNLGGTKYVEKICLYLANAVALLAVSAGARKRGELAG